MKVPNLFCSLSVAARLIVFVATLLAILVFKASSWLGGGEGEEGNREGWELS